MEKENISLKSLNKEKKNKCDIELMLSSLEKLKYHKEYIYSFCNNIAQCYNQKNKVIFCGVGKNVLLSDMICEFLHPFNIVSLTLDPHRAVHGNLGILEKDDILILSTKSGNTSELIYMMECLQRKIRLENKFLITSGKNCKLEKFGFKDILHIPSEDKEIARFDYSPQTTILSYAFIMFILVNALANKKEITKNDYLLNHQAGAIGECLKK